MLTVILTLLLVSLVLNVFSVVMFLGQSKAHVELEEKVDSISESLGSIDGLVEDTAFGVRSLRQTMAESHIELAKALDDLVRVSAVVDRRALEKAEVRANKTTKKSTKK